MELEKAIKIVADFKDPNLRINLDDLKKQLVGKTSSPSTEKVKNLLQAALIVKRISSQIDEIVHAAGIIMCLPKILEEGEIIQSLSLAAGAEGDGIDLVTDRRVAEFKFSQWQDSSNGARKRHVFADCVNLMMLETPKSKELYVLSAEKIKTFFKSKRSKWKNVLSKSGGLDQKLSTYLASNALEAETVNDIFNLSNVKIFEVRDMLT